MNTVLVVLGIGGFALGLIVSIALHEVGHLVPAKRFGVRVTQYMVGFGSTLWSTRRGETEYGIKAIPMGGYIRMVGMFPPARGADPARLRRASTGPLQSLVEEARSSSLEEIGPDDAERVFYRKPWWQKLIIMLGGPAMNVVLAAAAFAVAFMLIGVPAPSTTVGFVSDCVLPVSSAGESCGTDDPATPAKAAGLQVGDRIVAFGGEPVESWEQLRDLIRDAGGRTVPLVVERDGAEVPVSVTLLSTQRYADPDDPDPANLATVGFLGVTPQTMPDRQGPVAVVRAMGDFTVRSAQAVIGIPQKMVGVWQAAFGGERDPLGPVGVVGASRIGGEIASADVPLWGKLFNFVMLFASFNMAIALFNLIPLLPLDGGHVAGALYEAVRRAVARLRSRPDPGYVDVARALPLAYGVAILLIGMSALLLYADIVNPIRLGG